MQGFIIRNSNAVWDSDVHTGTVVLNSGYIPRLAVQRLQSKGCIFEIQQIDAVKKAGINAKQLKTGFKALFGSGVYTYLKTKRIEAAYEAVLQQDQTLKYIAKTFGYKSTGSFIKAFKKHFGKTPGEVSRTKAARND